MDDSHNSTIASTHPPNVTIFRRASGMSLELLNALSTWAIPIAFLLLAFVGRLWLLCFKFKKEIKKEEESLGPIKRVSPGKFGLPESFARKYNGINAVVDDYQYSMDLQIQEVLLASLSTYETSTTSSSTQGGRIFDSDPSEISCEICLEDKRSWEMFRNGCCSHSFCYECTSKHIVAKIQDNPNMVRCPGANCKATLDFNTCRSMIPRDILAKWDNFLCQSSIPESQKMFCPFRDCSVMLINDSGEDIKEIKCPFCRRSFCAACRVPWHPEFTCKEFQKLNGKKEEKDEKMFKFLAKKKSWQKCPSCKIHVERTEGCLHMTCRCTYEFCYRCGSKWSSSHTCKKKA